MTARQVELSPTDGISMLLGPGGRGKPSWWAAVSARATLPAEVPLSSPILARLCRQRASCDQLAAKKRAHMIVRAVVVVIARATARSASATVASNRSLALCTETLKGECRETSLTSR